eukprot:9000876-Alexandrium_andersonii.AAC.1
MGGLKGSPLLPPDMFKCVDQAARELVLAVALHAGCPTEGAGPWYRYLQGLSSYSSVGEGIGAPYKRRCAIPQGCPLSMMWIALLSRPLILLSRREG